MSLTGLFLGATAMPSLGQDAAPGTVPATPSTAAPGAATPSVVTKAPVLLDNTAVFEVSGDLTRTAAERARLIQLQLEAALAEAATEVGAEAGEGTKLLVSVGDRNGTPVLLLNNTLLTPITATDTTTKTTAKTTAKTTDAANTPPSQAPPQQATQKQQAEAWAKRLQAQLDELSVDTAKTEAAKTNAAETDTAIAPSDVQSSNNPPSNNPPSNNPPSTAQSSTAQSSSNAPSNALVAINSHRLFRIAEVGDSTAARRASEVSNKLETLSPTAPLPEVEIREEAGAPTLWLQHTDGSETYLLTVTQTDANLGLRSKTPEQTARFWRNRIRDGLRVNRNQHNATRQDLLVRTLGILGIALGGQWCIVRLLSMARRRLETLIGPPPTQETAEGNEHPYHLLNFALKILLTLLLSALWIFALLWAASLFPVTQTLSYRLGDYLIETLITKRLIPIGDGFSIASFVLLGGVLTAMVIASGALTDFLRSRFLAALGIGMGLQEAIAVVFKYSFLTLGVIILLQLWGIDLSSLAILASALGVGIGFGFQDIAKNLGSGLVLVFERPIQVGDFVEVGGYTGTIEKLSARSTHIRTMDDLTVFVPNSRFLEEEVTNWSHKRSPSRIKIPVGVAYGTDLEQVKAILLDIAQEHRNILKSPKPQIFFMGFGDSSLDLMLLAWISRPQMHVRIRSELNFTIDAAFRQHSIEIPFPQQDVNFQCSGLPQPLSPDAIENASPNAGTPPAQTPDSTDAVPPETPD